MRFWKVCSSFAGLVLLLSAAQVRADGMDAHIKQVMSSPAEYAQAQEAGKKAASFCANCHGETGNSEYDYIPNLAGQHPAYLINQFNKFADGRRKDDFMSGMIKLMKDADRFNAAIYYSAQSVRSSPVRDAALATRGKELFTRVCTACHGAKGYGDQTHARLAGQHEKYVKQSLEKYRKGAADRNDPVMGSIAHRLSDDDIASLAAYIPTMK
jgi:cbb3-type cytochrome c oxidase subunit III